MEEGKKKVLGKGLNALLSELYGGEGPALRAGTQEADGVVQSLTTELKDRGVEEIPISMIRPNRKQPRQNISEAGIRELADSIQEQGMLQPVIVRKADDGYELICGERRLRAAAMLGLEKTPAIVKEAAEDKLLEWALIENIQREDLNPVEEAEAYKRLVDERGLSQDELAQKVGKDRSTVANAIRLLRLPKELLDGLVAGWLQSGHARALLGLPSPEHQRQMAKRIQKESLSVRQVEEIVARAGARKRSARKARMLDRDIAALEAKLEQKLGTKARIFAKKNNQGRLEIHYYSLDDLDRILNLLGVPKS